MHLLINQSLYIIIFIILSKQVEMLFILQSKHKFSILYNFEVTTNFI